MKDNGIDVIKELRVYIATHFKGLQKEYAKSIGVSSAFVSSVMVGKKPPSKKMLSDLGIEMSKVTTIQYSRVSHASTTRQPRVKGA